jgi:predicted acyl esterase
LPLWALKAIVTICSSDDRYRDDVHYMGGTLLKAGIGPWAHGYPHFARPGPQIGFLQQILRWWHHWLKGEANGVMDEPMLRAWISANVAPAADHAELPGRWVVEDRWPPVDSVSSDLLLSNDGLQAVAMPLTAIDLRTSETVGAHAGEWCPFGYGGDQADDQTEDDHRSLTFDTLLLAESFDILGAPVVTLEISSDNRSPQLPCGCAAFAVGRGLAGQLRHPQPDAARWVRRAITADARAPLPRADSAQRRRREVLGRP